MSGPLGVLRQVAIPAGVLVGVLLLLPCSPWSLWGGAWCATANAAEATAPPAVAQPAVIDFARDVVAASKTKAILVDFNAVWCGPCKLLGPELERIAKERSAQLTLVPIDTDRNQQIAIDQGIEGIPDVRLWKGGREVARFVGLRPRDEILAWLDAALASPTPPGKP